MIKKKFIYNIAKRVRLISEIIVYHKDYKNCDWYEQNELTFFCGIGSYFLNKKLIENNIKSKLVYGITSEYKKQLSEEEKTDVNILEDGNHCWVGVDDLIVDITATQFAWAKDMPIIVSSSKEILKYYHPLGKPIFNDWSMEQRPNNKIMKHMESLYE